MNDGQMLSSALKALWSLCVNELNAGIATAEKAFKEIIKILEKYPKEEKIVEESMSAIWALCLEDDNEDLVIDAGIGLVIDALNTHPKNPKILRAALMALTAIASCGEIAAMRIICPAKNQSGIEIIVKAMETNITNKDCCEEFCLFLDEMLEEPDIKAELKKVKKVSILLKQISTKHKTLNKKVSEIENKLR